MKRYLMHALMLTAFWMFIVGSISFPSIVQGLALAVPISYVFRNLFPGTFDVSNLKKAPYLFKYFGVFLKALVISNLEVAYRILSPSTEVKPQIMDYTLSLDHPTAVAILADSITLTPGTLVLDYVEDESELVIHCLNGESTEETRKDIRAWEDILMKVFN
ncbi:hypothetical protein GLU60_01745 [Nanohaloarchaea archaeon H01]|nr:hypothetical protein [Nanohaloarchaea archaeon H01]